MIKDENTFNQFNNGKDSYNVLIRTDGNSEIATGHLMRCLSIASALTAQKAQVSFVVSDEISRDLLETLMKSPYEYSIFVLNTNYKDPSMELPAFRSLIEEIDPAFTLIDSYFVSPDYFESLKKETYLVYLDDLFLFDYPVHVIINYGTVANKKSYPSAHHLLTGPGFTPLREQFIQCEPGFRHEVKHILLSTGGSDPYHLLKNLCEKIILRGSYDQNTFHLVCSSMNKDRKALEVLCSDHPNFILHDNVKNMAELMIECDLAVSAGGTTLCELTSLGIPTLCYTMAENQKNIVHMLEKAGACIYCGSLEDPDTVSSILEQLENLSHDPQKRALLSKTGQNFVNRKGALEIAKRLYSIFIDPFS